MYNLYIKTYFDWGGTFLKNITSTTHLNTYITKHRLSNILSPSLEKYLTIFKFYPGEYITQGGYQNAYMYFLVEGKAKVCPVSFDEREIILDFLEAFCLIGDMELNANTESLQTVIACTTCVVIAIPFDIIDTHLLQNVFFNKLVYKELTNKLFNNSNRYCEAIFYSAKKRFTTYLYDLSLRKSSPTIDEMTQYLGITDRHARRIIKDLENEQLIKKENNKITVIHIELLKNYIETMI